ncbi:uncharacterized protein LOC103317096 [Nasonia vitripennis]|uniref:Uncharacterized protein n=1 Tax=Nasonia vitripennis TaxID=7425 RepID=A0A7M7LUV6_NASVI|nr:uncharacterized protein LOC103317096 [Nasonia vitripennis]
MEEKRKKLMNIDNNKCMLVFFVSEDKFQTGYTCWLDEKDQLNLKNIITNKTVVEIYSPNCAILSAGNMKALLKKAKFQKYAINILSHGDWLKVRESQKTL